MAVVLPCLNHTPLNALKQGSKPVPSKVNSKVEKKQWAKNCELRNVSMIRWRQQCTAAAGLLLEHWSRWWISSSSENTMCKYKNFNQVFLSVFFSYHTKYKNTNCMVWLCSNCCRSDKTTWVQVPAQILIFYHSRKTCTRDSTCLQADVCVWLDSVFCVYRLVTSPGVCTCLSS